MAEPPLGQPATRSSSRNRNSADLQQVITGDAAGATDTNNAGAGAPTIKAGKGKKRKMSAEKAVEDAAAASSAEASGALKKLVDSGQAVDPPGATLPPRKSILKVTWGDSEHSKTGPTPVTPPHRRDMSPLLHLTPQVERGAPVERTVAFEIKGHSNGSLEVETICECLPVYTMSSTDGGWVLEVETRPVLKALAETSSPLKLRRGEVSRYIGDRKIRLGRGPKLLGEEPIEALEQRVAGWIPVTVCEGNLTAALTWEHEELEPFNLSSTQGKAFNNAPPVAPLQHTEGPGHSNSQVGPPMVEQTGIAMLPILHERRSPAGTQPVGELEVTTPLQDHIRSEEDVMRVNPENSMEGNAQIKPPGQADEGGEGTYQATGRSRDNGLQTPQGLPLVQRAEECETVGEYLRRRLDLPRVEQIASKDVHAAHVMSWWRVVQHARPGMIELGWQRPRAKNLFKVGTGEGQWSRHAISEWELAALVNLGSSTLSSYNSTMEEAMKVDSLWIAEGDGFQGKGHKKVQEARMGTMCGRRSCRGRVIGFKRGIVKQWGVMTGLFLLPRYLHVPPRHSLASSSEFAAPTDHSSSTSTLLAVRPILRTAIRCSRISPAGTPSNMTDTIHPA
ncbi:hypothetical protein JB92DRAFT_3131253 [Gautieria morchelliformis]|nr:hypothetical protein JB92DRAFT_3131253 [Gautieria morchelliformis]